MSRSLREFLKYRFAFAFPGATAPAELAKGNKVGWGSRLRRVSLCFVSLAALCGPALLSPAPVAACDICAIYTAVDLGPSRSGFRIGVAEQYTMFDTRMEDSVEVSNPGERMQGSITQFMVGYGFGPSLGLQLNLPVIYRPYTRLEDGALVSGSESGIGDMAILGRYVPYRYVSERGLFRLTLFGGLKFPTGNSEPLSEEKPEDFRDLFRRKAGVASVDPLASVSHAESASAIHGHDLALGTGSYDGVVGGQVFGSWDRFFLTGEVQYTLRTEGSYNYQYANDLTFRGGPGYFLYLQHSWLVGLQGVVSGETKGQDTLDGEALDDTAATYVFAGPALRVGIGTNFSMEIIGDIPFIRHETSLQIVPNYRIRGGIVWRF